MKPQVHLIKRKNPSGKISYTVRWFDAARGVYRSKACGPDRERALEVKMQKRKAIREGIDDGEITRVDWESFADQHVEQLNGTANAGSVKHTLDEFRDLCKPKGTHSVTYAMVERYVKSLRDRDGDDELSPNTINLRLRELRAAFNAGVRRGFIRRNPMGKPKDGIRFERVDEPIPVVLSDDEKCKLLDACTSLTWDDPSRGRLWRTFLYMLMTTGCRRGEVLGLTWDRIDFDGAFIVLTRTKGKRDRLQPLVSKAADMLHDLHADAPKMVRDGTESPKEPLVFRALKWNTGRAFERIRKQSGVSHATMKALRSSVGSDTANAGFDVSRAGDFLGHSDYGVTRRHYILRDLESKRAVAESLAERIA